MWMMPITIVRVQMAHTGSIEHCRPWTVSTGRRGLVTFAGEQSEQGERTRAMEHGEEALSFNSGATRLVRVEVVTY